MVGLGARMSGLLTSSNSSFLFEGESFLFGYEGELSSSLDAMSFGLMSSGDMSVLDAGTLALATN